MKISRIILSAIVLFALPVDGKSQSPYTLTSKDVTVVNGIITSSILTNVSGDNYQADIIIPELLDGQVVKGIGENAFRDKSLAGVDFPDGLTSIKKGAFATNNIIHVTWPVGLTSIESSAFRDNSLIIVDLPEGVTSIGDFAFQNNRISSLNLPSGLTTIEESAFNVNFLISVDLPVGLTSIEASAFRDNRLTSLTLPSGLKSIGFKAFLANNLTHVELPDGLTFIGEDAFKFSSDLDRFVLPKGSTVGNSMQWQANDGTVLDAGHVVLPENFGNSYKVINID